VLSKDDLSPLGPESDEEKSEEAKKNAAAAKEKDQDKDEDKTKSGDAKAGDTKDGSEQESDRTRVGVSLTGAVGSVDWRVRQDDWSKILGWPGYTVYRHEIDERGKTLRLWVRRKRGNRRLICSGCGRRITDLADITEREVRDLPCFQYRTTVVIELYRVRCPECGLKIEKVDQLPSKAPFSKRFEEAVGQACEGASARTRGQAVRTRREQRPGDRSALLGALECAAYQAGPAADGRG
jgi:hypothetical protein